jgi:imidazolonepropionase-like amidohydrolase
MIRSVTLGLAAILLAGASPAQTVALTGATIIDGTGRPAIANGVIILRGDRLQCVGTAQQCPALAGGTRIDMTGRFITPGLVDAHVHFSQT